jgi:hypothetical protein
MLNLTAGRVSTITILTAVVYIFVSAFPFVLLASEPIALHIRVLIDNMRYEGKDAYSLVISTANSSSASIRVKIAEEGFFIQTDRGWKQLTVGQKGHDSREFLLPARGKNERAAVLSIPLTIPHLFRTYEGDLSLVYRYNYTMQTAEGTGAALQRADEVYCWIKPGTSDLILREGM